MKSQKEAERAEQQRIKSLVLNYELQDSPDQDGIYTDPYFIRSNPNLLKNYFETPSIVTHDTIQGLGGEKHQHNASLYQSSSHHTSSKTSSEKPGGSRGNQRARKLQLSDVDWYDKSDDRLAIKPVASSQYRGRGRGRSLAQNN